MTQRTKKRRRNWTEVALWIISLLVVLSMVLGYLVSMLSPEPTVPTPTETSVPLVFNTSTPSPTTPAPPPPEPTG